jgi:hypothetical protein
MTRLRLVLAIVAGCCLLRPAALPAADTTPPFAMEKHYSADLAITTDKGMNIQSKAYIDGDKMRSDVSMNGMALSIIVRKDLKKIYQIMDVQKMVMISDFDPNKNTAMRAAAAFGPEGKFELIGPDTVDGIACTKYKVTSDSSKQVYFFWLDTAHKVPYEMASADGALVVKWTNFVAGPQDASLFEPPAGYQTMEMPDAADMPGAP